MLFADINEVRYVIQVNQATSFDRLAPHIQPAEREVLANAISPEVLDVIQAFHDDATKTKITSPKSLVNVYKSFDNTKPADVEEANRILLWLCQYAIIHTAFFIGFDLLNALFTDGGHKRQESNEIKSLFKYQEDRIKDYYRTTGLNGIDTVIDFLERNVHIFTTYKAQSDTYKARIIGSTREFQSVYDIQNSRLVYMALVPFINDAINLILEPELGKTNIDFIISEIVKTSPDAKVVALLPYIRPVLAFYAVVDLMRNSGAEITEKGLFFRGLKAISNSDLYMPADKPRVDSLIMSRIQVADSYLSRLKQFMLASTAWQLPLNPRSKAITRDNTNKKSFVA